MTDWPPIKKYLSEKCIGYRNLPRSDDFVAIYLNIGVDSRGRMWLWKSETATIYDHNIGLFRVGFPEVVPLSFTHICPKGETS